MLKANCSTAAFGPAAVARGEPAKGLFGADEEEASLLLRSMELRGGRLRLLAASRQLFGADLRVSANAERFIRRHAATYADFFCIPSSALRQLVSSGVRLS